MPLTVKQLKKIAATAWTECWNYIGTDINYRVEIDGDKDKILRVLMEFAEECNNRDDNSDYICSVEEEEGKYHFRVEENEDYKTPCYEVDDDDEEIIADGAEIVDSENPAPDDPKWCDVRNRLMEAFDDREFWQNDHLCLALNWGNCLHEGRHEKTSDADWTLFLRMTNIYLENKQDYCYTIYQNLCEERLKIYWELEGENWESLKEAY